MFKKLLFVSVIIMTLFSNPYKEQKGTTIVEKDDYIEWNSYVIKNLKG